VESGELSQVGRVGISTPLVVTVHTMAVMGGGNPWYVPIKYGS